MRLTLSCAGLLLAMISQAAHAQDTDESKWSITAAGGITAFAADQEQPYISAFLRRDLGDFHLSLGAIHVGYDGPPPIIGDTIPATTRQLVLGAGYETTALGIDTYISIGDRDFDTIDVALADGTVLQFEADGSSWATGAAATYQIPLGGRWYISPFATVDYSEIDTVQALAGPGGNLITRQVEESGVTGAAGATLQYALGAQSQHSLGLYSAGVTTSNTASTTRIGDATSVTNTTRRIAGTNDGDSWFEYGASASFMLVNSLVLDLSISRTAGLAFGEATSTSAGLTLDF